MKTSLHICTGIIQRTLTLAVFLFTGIFAGHSQTFKGKDGAAAYSTSGTYILNRYTTLASPATYHSLSITVSDITELNGSTSFTNSVNPYVTNVLSKGDLIMIIQMQGADIITNDDSSYGTITNYQNTGNYELRTVYNVSGNMILLCQPLENVYSQGGRARTQVIRVPRLTTLTVNAGVTISGLPWSAGKGGVVAIETANDLVMNGAISANAIGFNGGTDDKLTSAGSGGAAVTLYRTTVTTTTAGKGESIAGNAVDYSTVLSGANGRGAVANGGGGGNGHNSGGGGGSNAGVNGTLTPWNGTGLKNISTSSWSSAWNLEAPSFATDISTGGGRGGYTYANSNQDALVVAPNNTAWGGDYRHNVGGFGGRPLDYAGNTRLFLGGGGGAGDGNNAASGNGGNGGGIVYLLSNAAISGTGTITANGQQGYNTILANIDAAGGAGGGGAVVMLASGTITGVTVRADGGVGGNQLYLAGEAEGPGGGGGGGYIATTTTSVTMTANGGSNGVSQSALITEFLPNGATQGAGGTIVSKSFTDVLACNEGGYVLPLTLVSFNATYQAAKVMLDWVTANEVNTKYFEIERSIDGRTFTKAGFVMSAGSSAAKTSYNYMDDVSASRSGVLYYRLKMVDGDGKFSYSDVRVIKLTAQAATEKLVTYPNPAQATLYLTLPSGWQAKKVDIELYDVSGKLLMSVEKNSAGQTESLNVQQLTTGFYVIRAFMGAQTLQQRVIKN